MIKLNGEIERDELHITEDTKLLGMIIGNVIVNESVNFSVTGMIKGSLQVMRNANE